MYQFQDFPKWKYSPNQPPVIVNSGDEETNLGTGWFDTPSDYGVETCPGITPDESILENASDVVDSEDSEGSQSGATSGAKS